MNLTLSEDQTLIKESARKFLDYNYTFEKRREIIESENNSYLSHWQDYAELGWLGLPFSEEVGGFDGNINNLMTLMECFGSALTLEPYIFNNLIVGKFVEKIAFEHSDKYFEDIISGNKIYSFLLSPTNNYQTNILSNLKIIKKNNKSFLSGRYDFVFGIDCFDYLFVPVYSEGKITLLLIPHNKEGFEIRNYETIDNMIVSNVEFNDLELGLNEILIEITEDIFFKVLDYIYDLATLSICSQSLGIIDKMYDLTLEYCKTRKQFGKTIGSFQVIQHRLVDMYITKEEMRSLNYMAQVHFDKNKQMRNKYVSLNKIFLGTHAKNMSQSCVQLHGGMGVAKEMSIGHYFSKITSYCTLFGNIDYHKERYAEYD